MTYLYTIDQTKAEDVRNSHKLISAYTSIYLKLALKLYAGDFTIWGYDDNTIKHKR